MPVHVGTVKGTRHRSEPDGTSAAKTPERVSARKSAMASPEASAKASAAMASAAMASAAMAAAASSKYSTRSQDQ